jgi:pimeloyl-ACP methyl ester carboxylesterase
MLKRLFAAMMLTLAVPTLAAPPEARVSITASGKGPDVIFIPGLASSPQVWDKAIAGLNRKYRVHRVQLTGFGGAGTINRTGPVLDGVIDELHAYVKRHKIKRAAVVGHSMGGFLSLMLALRHPEDTGRIMIVDSLPFAGLMFGAPDVAAVTPGAAAMSDQMVKLDQAGFAAGQGRTMMSLIKSDADRPWLVAMAGASDPATVGQVFYEVTTTDLRSDLAKLKVPATVLYAHNAYFTAEMAAQAYGAAYQASPRIKLIPVADSYHFIMQDQPTVFARELAAFLAAK